MFGKLALIGILLIAVASAETINVGNYTIKFDYNRPHEINQSDNATILKTFDGWVVVFSAESITTQQKPERIGSMAVQNRLVDVYSADGMYILSPEPKADLIITSTMDLTNLSDFLKSLKVEKAKAS